MKIPVRAKAPGVCNNQYMDRGNEFLIEEALFSDIWMEKIEKKAEVKPDLASDSLKSKKSFFGGSK